jgi:hypothetical protein
LYSHVWLTSVHPRGESVQRFAAKLDPLDADGAHPIGLVPHNFGQHSFGLVPAAEELDYLLDLGA